LKSPIILLERSKASPWEQNQGINYVKVSGMTIDHLSSQNQLETIGKNC